MKKIIIIGKKIMYIRKFKYKCLCLFSDMISKTRLFFFIELFIKFSPLIDLELVSVKIEKFIILINFNIGKYRLNNILNKYNYGCRLNVAV